MFPLKKLRYAVGLTMVASLSSACTRSIAPEKPNETELDAKRKELRATPSQLVIETQAVVPVKNGRTLPLQAFLVEKAQTKNGVSAPEKRREVTEEVQWSVQPQLPWIAGAGHLDYECLSQDVQIHADLLGERQADFTLPIRKKIKTLSVEVNESSQIIERSEYIQLKVVAYCEDGTQSEVTCQSNWNLPPGLGRMGRCGNLQITDPEVRRLGEFTISADYAAITATRRLHFKTLDR